MVQNQYADDEFDQRVDRIERQHRMMGAGYSAEIQPDGLIVIRPRHAPKGLMGSMRPRLKPILLALAGLILFKGLLLSSIGPDAYEDRLAHLRAGSVFEKAGAWVMRVEPASAQVAAYFGPILR